MQLRSHVAVALVLVAATAPIRTLAWEPPYAVGAAPEKAKKDKKKKKSFTSLVRLSPNFFKCDFIYFIILGKHVYCWELELSFFMIFIFSIIVNIYFLTATSTPYGSSQARD